MKQNKITLVITDHQLTADTIAKAIGANALLDGYYLGNGYAVTWTNGSIIEATFCPDKHLVFASSMNSRQMYAHNFRFSVRDIDAFVGYEKSTQDNNRLETIKSLLEKSDTVVNAMSPDIAGELDFLNLQCYLHINKPVRRAWMPMLTKGAIIKAVENGPKDETKYEEWLSAELFDVLLAKMPESEGSPKGECHVVEISALEVTLPEENESEIVLAQICAPCGNCLYNLTEQPTLFNLPRLLVAAAVTLDFDHEKTLQIAYTLYAKKLISYPFVQQNTLPWEVWKQMRRNIKTLRYNSKWGVLVPKGKLTTRHNFRMGENPYNGHGIVTTGLHPTDLKRDEERLYNLIVMQVIDALRWVKKPKSKSKKPKNKAK